MIAPAPMVAPAPMPAQAMAPGPARNAYVPASVSPMPDASRFNNAEEGAYRLVAQEPVSTFSMSADTLSYAVAKRAINEGYLPPAQAVRPEEFINAFHYRYAAPRSAQRPFEPTVSVFPAPWDATKRLMQVGLRSYAPPRAARPKLNLVFLVDVSGSMSPPDRLELVRKALGLLVPQLRPEDRVSLVTYANGSRVVLDSVAGDRQGEIRAALDGLVAGGGTGGAQGLQTAYDLAARNFDASAVNRVVLATDGDFNLGPSSPQALEELITARRAGGVYLTTMGVGLDNLNDRTLNTLAKAGNGTSIYAGNLEDARRALVEDFSANIVPVADDVKLQVEFNPAEVSQYRLIGYETRALRREDFNNDRVDAGEVGSGREVTALYEFVPADGAATAPIEPLRYARPRARPVASSGEFAFLRIRYKLPGEARSRLIERAVVPADVVARFEEASEDARFATAVAGFAQVLRRSRYLGDWGLPQVEAVAAGARGADEDGRRAEFVSLVRLAQALKPAGR
ncbi:vWA domain-containing protein [Roseomonas elaeocarpi]|uniref:von Willebrand factor type A domain-containing protein n=1 Tax=Roseomonas elaeocarpi TaxID=907779 RepID=A0ABV6JRP8_9PROT